MGRQPGTSAGSDDRRGPGRPKSESKHEQIVGAARVLFPQRGITGTSMADIAAQAGVARQTLYSHFTDKEALFREVVARVRRERTPARPGRRGGEAQGTENPDGLSVLTDPDILVALAGLATYLVELITDPELAALRRLVVSEDLPRHWRGIWALDGPDVLQQALAHDLALRPELEVPDAGLAADQFFALITHRATLDTLYRIERPDKPADHYRVVEACVTFLRAHRA